MIKLDEFTKDELETLKELIDKDIKSAYRMKDMIDSIRLKGMEDKRIEKLGLLRVKIGNMLGDYQHGE